MIENRSNSVMKLYRLSNKLYKKKIPILPGVIMRIIRVMFSCDIPYALEIGENTIFAHNGLGVVLHRDAIIGNNNKIMQHVTIGGKNGQGPPKIGNYCFVGSGAMIMGEIEIGDDVLIGANAVVTKSVENGMVVAGVPAKVIGKTDPQLIGVYKL